MITQAQLKELFDYDAETGNLVWKVDRGSNKMMGKVAGTVNCRGYMHVRVDGPRYLTHRLVWFWHYGSLPKNDIDHINGIRTDNRFENLREATRSENMQNQKKPPSNNVSGYLGASRHKNGWRASIGINKQKIHIGIFDTPEEAHAAYLTKKRELHPFQTIA